MALDGRMEELLSAYLTGDVSPDERAVVEKLLAQKPELQALQKELQELRELLKRGERHVNAQMVTALRDRVLLQLKSHAVPVQALLAASLTDDVTAQERDTVENYLKTHPSARRQLVALRQIDDVLAKGRLNALPALSEKLTARLKNKLPAAAFAAPVTETQVMPAAQTASARKPAPATLRVYSVRQNAWKRGASWVAAAAAVAVTVTVGVVIVRNVSKPVQPENTVAHGSQRELPNVSQPEKIAVAPRVNTPPAVNHGPFNAPYSRPEVTENVPSAQSNPLPAPNVLPEKNQRVAVQKPEKETQPRQPKEIRNTTENNAVVAQTPVEKENAQTQPEVANNTQPRQAPNQNSSNGSAPLLNGSSVVGGTGVNTPSVATNNPTNSGATGTGSTTVAPPTVADNTPTPMRTPAENTPETSAQANTAMVLTVKDGNVQARSEGTPAINLQPNLPLPSGSEIVTDRGRVALQLPGDGRLWINRSSNVQIVMKNRSTTITLNSGEIAYRAPSGGSLTIIAGGQQLVREARSIDAKLSGNQLTVYGLEKTASVGPKGKAVTITPGSKAVATLGAEDTPLKEAGAPDAWRQGLDGADDNKKTITSDATSNKSRKR